MKSWWLCLALLVAPACGGRETPKVRNVMLRDGAIVRVGSNLIAGSTVQRVAQATDRTSREAVDAIVGDALLAAELDESRPATARVVERGVLARALFDELLSASAKGDPTHAELARAARRKWLEVARPRAVRTADVLVPVAPLDSLERIEAAKELAERMREVAQGIHDPDGFADAVRSVPANDFEVVVRGLPPVAADGRVVPTGLLDQGQIPGVDADFAKAAHELTEAGQLSPVVETRQGFHLILAIEVLPERRLDRRDLEAALHRDVLSERAAPLRDALLKELREKTPVQVPRNALSLTRRVPVER